MNRMRFLAIVIAIVTAISLSIAPERGIAQDELTVTKLELTTKPALDDKGHAVAGQYKIIATLTNADGRFVPKMSIKFVENLEFFGPRISDLGAATTNGTGTASIIYQPSQTGQHTIIARFAGNDKFAPADTQFNLDAADAISPFSAAALPLASVGKWLSLSLALLGIAFWAVLLGVVGRAAWLIRAAPGAAARIQGRETPSKEAPI